MRPASQRKWSHYVPVRRTTIFQFSRSQSPTFPLDQIPEWDPGSGLSISGGQSSNSWKMFVLEGFLIRCIRWWRKEYFTINNLFRCVNSKIDVLFCTKINMTFDGASTDLASTRILDLNQDNNAIRMSEIIIKGKLKLTKNLETPCSSIVTKNPIVTLDYSQLH